MPHWARLMAFPAPDFFCLKKKKPNYFLTEVWLIYNVVLVSGVQKSDSVIYMCVCILFQTLFPYRFLQSIV